MCLPDSEITGRHTALTQEFRSSQQTCWSHVLEAQNFLQDRGLKTHSLWMSFLPQRKIAFFTFCDLRVTLCLKSACLEVYFQWQYLLEAVTIGRGPTLTGKGKATSKWLFQPVFSVEELLDQRSVWKFLESRGDTSHVWTWIPDLGCTICIFLSGCHKEVWLAIAWKSIQLLFSYFWQCNLWSTIQDFWSKLVAHNS